MQEKTHILDRVSSFSLLLTMVILMIIGAALIPLVDVGSSPKPRQGKTLTISYGWRNASPKVVEQEVTSKIEGLVSAVKGVAEVSSESYFGSGRVTVVLKKEADVSAVKFEISSLLKQVRKKLPEEVSYPELTGGEVVNDEGAPKENTASHLLTYQVNSNLTGEQIKEYVKENVEPVVRAWEEVVWVDVTGGTSKYMEITYDPLIVANYGLTVADVEDGIKSFIGKSDIVGDVMYRDEGGEQSRVTLYLKTSRFSRQIGEMPLKTVNGKIIYLNDLATFEYRDRLPGSYYRVNGLNTVYMNIFVDADANEIELSRQLRAKIEELKPRLRDGMYLTLTHDAAKDKQSELEKLITRTLMSLAILLVFVWLVRRNWKYLSIIAITLAANILIAVMAYYVFDMRLHTFSLAGITVSLGLIIDAAIVMVDHYSYYHNRKAFLAILAALLTTIGSLVVVFFMPEYIQRDLYDFSWIIIINLTVALVVALFFMPATGLLHAIHVKNGSLVKKGALLASVDDREARRELAKAEQEMEKAEVELVDKLIGQGYDETMAGVPEAILKRAKVTSGYTSAEYALQTARLNLERCNLYAPFAGRVADMDCKLYQQPKEKFCTLIDDTWFDVEFSILEAELQSVSIGQKVVVSPFVDENEEFTGKVTEVNPSIDEKGQVKIRARIRNRGNVLMEGMNVKVVIEKEVPDMFVVPKDAVVMRDGFHVLFRLEDGRAVWTYVDVVYSNISQYAVTGNARKETKIEDGDVVITSGNLNLADGTEVIPRERKEKKMD
jgi:RND family efflux transporter MFP subunit